MKHTQKIALFILLFFSIHLPIQAAASANEQKAFAEMMQYVEATIAMSQTTPAQRKELAEQIGMTEEEFNKTIDEAVIELDAVMKQMGTSLDEITLQMGLNASTEPQYLPDVERAQVAAVNTVQQAGGGIQRELEGLASVLATLLQKSKHPFIYEAMQEIQVSIEALIYNTRTIAASNYYQLLAEENYKETRALIVSLREALQELVATLPMPDIHIEEPYSKYGLKLFAQQSDIEKTYELIKNEFEKNITIIQKSSLSDAEKTKRIQKIRKEQEFFEEDFETLLNKDEKAALNKNIKLEMDNQSKQNKNMHKIAKEIINVIKNYTTKETINEKIETFIKEYLPKEYEESKARDALAKKRIQEEMQIKNQKTNIPSTTETLQKDRGGNERDYEDNDRDQYSGGNQYDNDYENEREQDEKKEPEKAKEGGGGGKKGSKGKPEGGEKSSKKDRSESGSANDNDKEESDKKSCEELLEISDDLNKYSEMINTLDPDEREREIRKYQGEIERLITELEKCEKKITAQTCPLKTIEEATSLLVDSEEEIKEYIKKSNTTRASFKKQYDVLKTVIDHLLKKHPQYPCNMFIEHLEVIEKLSTNLVIAEQHNALKPDELDIVKDTYSVLQKTKALEQTRLEKRHGDKKSKDLQKIEKDLDALEAQLLANQKKSPNAVNIGKQLYVNNAQKRPLTMATEKMEDEDIEEPITEKSIKEALSESLKSNKEKLDKTIKKALDFVEKSGGATQSCSNAEIQQARETIMKNVDALMDADKTAYEQNTNSIRSMFEKIPVYKGEVKTKPKEQSAAPRQRTKSEVQQQPAPAINKQAANKNNAPRQFEKNLPVIDEETGEENDSEPQEQFNVDESNLFADEGPAPEEGNPNQGNIVIEKDISCEEIKKELSAAAEIAKKSTEILKALEEAIENLNIVQSISKTIQGFIQIAKSRFTDNPQEADEYMKTELSKFMEPLLKDPKANRVISGYGGASAKSADREAYAKKQQTRIEELSIIIQSNTTTINDLLNAVNQTDNFEKCKNTQDYNTVVSYLTMVKSLMQQ